MRITATDRAVEIVRRAGRERDGELSVTLGTGCCESTAPFLYEDYFSGPDHEVVGEIDGVPVLAPSLLRDLYEHDHLVIDLIDEFAESLSVETEWGVRLVLRGHEDGVAGACASPAVASAPVDRPDTIERRTDTRERNTTDASDPSTADAPRRPIELPDELKGIRIR
jgi:hypothetical protein